MADWYKPLGCSDRALPHLLHGLIGRPDAAGDANERTCFRRSCARRRASVVAVGVSGASGGSAANTLTVWLQVDAQSGWPEVVAAANAQFKAQNPGLERGRPVPDVGYPPREVRRDPGGRQRAGRHRDGEHGDDEVHGGWGVPGSRRPAFPNQSTWLAGLAASGRYGGKLYGVPYYAGSRVVTYRTDLFKQVNAKIPQSQNEFIALARKLGAKNKAKSFSPVYIAGTDWYLAMSFVYDYGGTIAVTRKGKWIGTLDRPAALAGLAAYKRFFDASSRAPAGRTRGRRLRTASMPRATQRRCTAPAGSRAASVTTRARRAVRDAEPHEGPAYSGFPRRLGPRRPGRRQQGRGGLMDQRLHRQRVDDGTSREGEHPEHDEPARAPV